ncbi:response regulator transcription factor [Candidatus Parcubacteria bacterium]|nr:response regulator transcription factor [Candidatus Parcubacteria bacterium]
MRILIVEDDPEIRDSLKQSLEAESFAVDSASDGEKGSYMARTNDYDIILLDVALPKKDGCTICTDIRAAGKTTPIMMLSVMADAQEKIRLLNAGADDYMSKPFSFRELMARIRALMRRPTILAPDILTLDDLIVDIPKQKVTRGEKSVYLTRKEFSLLEYLMRHKGIVISRGMIMEHVWNAETDPFSNTIEAHILNIRKKIDTRRKSKLIHTIPGRGYKIDRD